MKLDIDLAQQTTSNNLPYESQYQMFANLNYIHTTNIDDRATYALGRFDDDVVVLSHVESIESLGFLSGHVQNTLIYRVRHAVVDEFGQDQAIFTFIKHLKRVGGKWHAMADVGITRENGIDVTCELGSFVLVDRVRDVGIGSLNVDLASNTSF